MKKANYIIATILMLFYSLSSYAFDVKIGILGDVFSQSAEVSIQKGVYNFYDGDLVLVSVKPGDVAQVFNMGNDEVKLVLNGDEVGLFAQIKMQSIDSSAVFSLKITNPDTKQRTYPDALLIYGGDGKINFLNCAELEDYVAGVIEGEAGNTQQLEMLKVQAIMSRTYAIGHLDKHYAEGFMVCDKVHCQVYRGLQVNNALIPVAVDSTRGLIITDTSNVPIQCAFHANCGGRTCNSEDVWLTAKPYLRGVIDTFCRTQINYRWTKRLSTSSWINYLERKSGRNTNAHCGANASRSFNFDGMRGVSTRDIRTDFSLKSAYFSVECEGDEIVLHGRGFGHGVGLCQQGAIEMAKDGYFFDEIINHYFTNVRIVHKVILNTSE